MPASENVRQLVKRFEANRESYRSGKYNETQLRREFLDPFFEALGWDIFNKGGYAETYKDVIHEDSLEIEGENKAPDYSFRIGGVRKFFVEAKKPAVNIESNIHPAFQLRRYAWSAKFPISILTDFEEFAIYDCRTKPDKKDKASLGRISLYSFKDYIDKWDEIAAVFSRDAVLKGSFDEYAENLKGKKGTTEVDDAFLAEIERWRDLLAKNIALRNSSLNVRELNYAVQMTIDRIIFLRICEDRGVERDEQLKEIATNPLPASPKSAKKVLENQETLNADLGEVPDRAEGVGSVYAALCALFKKADARYNSGLFHFKEEKEQSGAADSLTLSLNVDDKVLQDILKNLYYPESPYVFREIPSDILGQVYERFLGKVIRLTAGHQAKVEEKPEVRKAGGVYYTPTYIVEYIVQNTVGKLLEGDLTPNPSPERRGGLTPKEVAKLKFLDPACGSGTFPLGAFQYLLDWHLKWYLEHEPEKWMTGKNPAIYESKDGHKLTTAKKKEILLNNIFGVDIDAQAVEVTKLSLLLKVLEGESSETIGSQLALFQERVLPDLGHNIKCGNSLIGPDYYEGKQLTMGMGDGEEERYRVNAFNWKAEFSDVFIRGGFDVVIGNPPYVVLSDDNFSPESLKYLSQYKVAKYKTDLFHLFIEKGIDILRETGVLGFITPSTWFTLQFSDKLREFVLKHSAIQELTLFEHKVFEDANVHTGLTFLKKQSNNENNVISIKQFSTKFKIDDLHSKVPTQIQQAKWLSSQGFEFEVRQTGKSGEIVSRLLRSYPKLEIVARASLGAQAYNSSKHTQEQIKNRVFHASEKLSEEYLPELAGNDVGRYLIDRRKGQWIKYGSWLHDYRSMDWLTGPRVLIREISGKAPYRICAAYVEEVFCNYKTILNVNPSPVTEFSMKYLLGLLNSKLISFIYPLVSNKLIAETFPRLSVRDVKRLPIRPINFSDPAEKAMHDKMVSLVERMLALHKQSPRAPQEQAMVKREIESTDRGIDRLVYELYGLTEDEIGIVEKK